MGNDISSFKSDEELPLFHGKELKWKTGPIQTSLPIDGDIDTYEKLKVSALFKEYVLQHIDDDDLIRTLVSSDGDDNSVLEGITSYQLPQAEEMETLAKDVVNLENCTMAGIQVKLSEAVRLLEQQIASSIELEKLPFLLSIQKRLTIFRELNAAVSHSRKLLVCSEKNRKWSKKSLNSLEHPSLSALSAFTDFGTSILDILPLLLENIRSKELEGPTVKVLSTLFQKFGRFKDLSLFNSWSPRVQPPLKALELLTIASVESPTGDSKNAIDGKKNTCWRSEGGVWKLVFNQPQKVDWIRISWINEDAIPEENFQIGAPAKLSIYVIYETIPGAPEKPKLFQVLDPEKEKQKQGSWVQYFKLNALDVKKIVLLPSSKICSSSSAIASEIYDFSAFVKDSDLVWMDNLKLFRRIQSSFFSALPISSVSIDALIANLGLLRATGSLSLCLVFIENFLKRSPVSLVQKDHFELLLKAISQKEIDLVLEFNKRNCRITETVSEGRFSISKRSESCILESSDKIQVSAESGFCCIDVPLVAHAYEWELIFTSVKGIRIGITECSESAALLEKSWLIDIESGDLYSKSATASSKIMIEPATSFKLSFDCNKKQLSLHVNDQNIGVLFEQISGKVTPVIFFESCPDSIRSVQLQSFTQILNPSSQIVMLKNQGTTVMKASSTQEFATELLEIIGNLSAQMMKHLALVGESESRNYLESPFCLEISLELFPKIYRVLEILFIQKCWTGVEATLRILELQFHVLNQSNLDLTTVERFFTEDCPSDIQETFALTNLQEILQQLINIEGTIGTTASLTYARGIKVFAHDNCEWISKVTALFVDTFASENYGLLRTLIESFANLETTKLLLNGLNSVDSGHLKTLLQQLLKKLQQLDLERISIYPEKLSLEKESFLNVAKKFLLTFSEEVTLRVVQDSANGSIFSFQDDLFVHLVRQVLVCSQDILKRDSQKMASPWEYDRVLRGSFICSLLHAVLYSLSIETIPLKVVEALLDDVQSFTIQINEIAQKAKICLQTLNTIANSISRKRNNNGGSSSVGGWSVVKAVFEDADSSFSISDNGTTYTSLHSSNTCALVNHRFTTAQRGAWEFLLESDSPSDECSVFGAARQPLRSRCYSSSNDLWMRRAYNGYMYNQGTTTGVNMDKIHPGDVVRIEFNGPDGTLSFSVNGGEMDVGFTDIVDDVYPACGSYRNGVVVKLLKVEVFNNQSQIEEDVANEDYLPSKYLQWVLPDPLVNTKDPTMLQHLVSAKEKKSKKSKSKWLTARGSKGAAFGVHDWEFQFGSFVDAPWSVGFVWNESPSDSIRLANEKTALPNGDKRFYAWRSDGSLWCDGEKLCNSFGNAFFPLKKFSAIKLRINRFDRTASFFMNGEFIGVAFGPSTFLPAAVRPLPQAAEHIRNFSSNIIYPAASIFDTQMTLKIRSAGMETSIAIPLFSSLNHSSASILGRITARMIQGVPVDANEKDLMEWLRSAIFSGGIDSSFLDSSRLEALPQNSLSELQRRIAELSTEDNEVRELTESENFILELAHGYNLDQTESAVSLFYEWLERIDPESTQMRKALERNGAYRFPSCELPFVACLLKHAGMLDEAYTYLKKVLEGENPAPSEEMFLVWQKVKQLRSNLRRKRQQLKVQSLSLPAMSSSTVSLLSPISADGKASPNDNPGEDENNPTDLETSVLTDNENPVYLFDLPQSVKWANDLDLTTVNEKAGAKATIKALGLDCENYSLYVYLLLSTTASDKKLPSVVDSTVKVGENELGDLIILDKQNTAASSSCNLLIFDISCLEANVWKENEFSSFILEEDWESITFSNKIFFTDHRGKMETTDEFQSFCNSIAAKSQFLLLMKSSWNSTDASTKTALLGLSSLYFQRSMSMKMKDDQSRWRTQERWKRVIEFLHVNSKIRRQLSTESEQKQTGANASVESVAESLSMDGDIDGSVDSSTKLYTLQHKEEVSTAQAAIQASSVFVNSEDSLCSAENLYKLMQTRLQRANDRIKALKILRSTLNNPAMIRNPLLLFELLVVVKNSIPPSGGKKAKSYEKERSHYLINLEGCSAAVLKSVQNAFASLYTGLGEIFTNYVQTWDQACAVTLSDPTAQFSFGAVPPPHLVFQGLLMVLKMWTIQFSNRDYGWIVNSSILPALFKVISFSFHEKIVNQWHKVAASILSLDHASLSKENIPTIKLYSKDVVFNGITNGKITGRSLLFNLYHYALGANYSQADLQEYGLDRTFASHFNYFTALESTTKIFCQLTQSNEVKSDAVESAKKAEAAEKEAEEARKLKLALARVAPSGIFDSDLKAQEIKLSELNSIATLREDRSGTSICVYTTLKYDLDHPGDHGNYFEITVLTVGQGDIGIGFADQREFSVRDNMPGWVRHSYAYHGDDGKKYGSNSTPGDFPVFEEGDVIGCGIRFDTKTIFYTRNGALLGDGFTEIEETIVSPIIGFSNRHNDTVVVKINFGADPFAYIGSEVIVNSKALEERERRSKTAIEDSSGEVKVTGADSELAMSETKRVVESPSINLKETYEELVARLKVAECQLFEYSELRKSALLLVRYLLVLSSDTQKDTAEPHKEVKGQSRPPLLKDVSTFGTPKAMTKADESKIQNNISSALIHELFIGSLYIAQGLQGTGSAHSFAHIEEKLLDYNFSEVEDDTALVELPEVIRILREHLTTLNIVLSSSEFIRHEVGHSNSLMTLFTLLACPAADIQDSVMCILEKILPHIDPDIVESSIPAEWKAKIQNFEACLIDWKCGKRSRKMPDTFIRAMLLDAALVFLSGHSSSLAMSQSPSSAREGTYGVGDYQLRATQLKFKLLQRLFSVPSWTELIAANLGTAFKHAASLMLDEDIWNTLHTFPEGGELILHYAAVCCGTMNGFPLLIPGSKVEIANSTAMVVGGCDYGAQVEVVFDSNLNDFYFGKHVEPVEREKIRLLSENCEVDFTTVSQPVLPNLFALTKQLLNWLLENHQAFPNDLISRSKLMVLGVLFSTVLSLMNTQTEVVMENLQDTNSLKDLLHISLIPSKLPVVLNFADALNLWTFLQARVIEQPPHNLPLANQNSLSRQVSRQLSRQVSSSSATAAAKDTETKDVSAQQLEDSGSEPIEISLESRQAREEIVQRLSEEFSLPKEFCQAWLEYAMLDEARAREILRTSQPSTLEDRTDGSTSNAAITLSQELSDESLIKGIQHARIGPIEASATPESLLNYFQVEHLENSANLGPEGEDVYILESEKDGLIKYDFGMIGTAKGISVSGPNVFAKFFNFSNGLIYYKLLPKTGACRVTAMHHPLNVSSKQSVFSVLMTMVILSARSLTKSLLLSGYSYLLNSPDGADISNALQLIKLISATDSQGIGQSLTAICNALPETNTALVSPVHSNEEQLVDRLVENAKHQLQESCVLDLNHTTTSSEDVNQECFHISSPHPFRGPCTASGEIVIPSTWKGATFTFNPKCRTPSDKAVLKLFTSREDFDLDRPLYSFFGQYSLLEKMDPANAFRDLTFNDAKSIFYRFEVAELAEKYPIGMKDVQGSTIYDSEGKSYRVGNVKTDSSKPVGLGEEDSLFNLFDEPGNSEEQCSVATIVTMTAEQATSQSGCWHFQVILHRLPRETTDCFFRIGVMEVDAKSKHTGTEEFSIGNSPDSCGIGQDGAIYVNSQVVGSSSMTFTAMEEVVVDVLFEILEDNYTIAFLANNQFTHLWTGEKVGKGILPAVSFSNTFKIEMNFGQARFHYHDNLSLEEGIFNSLILPYVDSVEEAKRIEVAWGYDFLVKPLKSLNLQVGREFDLIWSPKGDDSSSSSSSSTTSKSEYTKRVWIWRPKAMKDFVSVSDIVTTTSTPPNRSLLVFKDQGKHPKSFECVFTSSKAGIGIWRPIPETGYVAMGDVFNAGTNAPPTSSCLCLPRWAVKDCDVSQSLTIFKKVGDGKTTTNASLWKVDHRFGYFFGSPYERRKSSEPRHADFKCDGVGKGFSYVNDVSSLLNADWSKELEILSQPSIIWSRQLIHSLLTSDKWHTAVLTDSVFKTLVNYLRSSHSAAPLEIVPLLILMVRQANRYKISLSMHEMKGLCHVVLKEAVDMVRSQKKSELPIALMKLVDLVVEIQVANVIESAERDRITISRNLEKGKIHWNKDQNGLLTMMEETKEESSAVIEEKEMETSEKGVGIVSENSAAVSADQATNRWWERPNLDVQALKIHRVMKKDSVVHLVDGSETVLMKLKQALKFLFAVSSSDPLSSTSSASASSSSSLALDRSFPKLMTAKIWYETISLCQFVQSSHPYRERNFVKKVTFPGVRQLSVQFDRRCALNPGDKLTLSSNNHQFVLTSTITENYLKKGVEFINNEITITFEAGCTSPEAQEWGWAFTIFTSGPAYESAETTIDLDALISDAGSLSSSSSSGTARGGEEISIEEAVERMRALKLSEIGCEVPLEDPEKDSETGTGGGEGSPRKKKKSGKTGSAVTASDSSEESDTASVMEVSEDMAATEGDEGGQSSSSMMEVVGIDSRELLQAEEEHLEFLFRPQSKRGKRERRVRIKTPAEEEKEKGEEEKPKEGEEIDPTLDIIEFLGQRKAADLIAVPHAKELEIKIERSTANPNPESSSTPTTSTAVPPRSTDFTYLLKVLGEVEGTVTTRILLTANESRTIKLPGASAHYELFAMKNERLQQVIEGLKKKKEVEKGPAAAEAERECELVKALDAAEQEEEGASLSMKAEGEEGKEESKAGPSADWESLLGWSCSLCTYFNTNDRTVCEICGNPNEVLAPVASDSTAAPSGDAVSAGWWCPVCTLVNPLRATSCNACGTARVTGEEAGGGRGGDEKEGEEADKKEEDEEDLLLASPTLSDIVVSKPSAISASVTTGDLVKISAKGKFDIIGKFEARLEGAVASRGKILTPLQVHHRLSTWTRECDEALLDYLNNTKKETSNSSQKTDAKLQPFQSMIPKQYLLYQGQALSRLTMIDLMMRSQIIEAFNKTLETLLPLIDLSNDDPFSLGAMIRKSNRYLLMKIKQPLLEKAINATSANNSSGSSPPPPDVPATLQLDNFKSLHSREKGDKDPSTSQNCFVQAFRQLQKKDAAVYRYIISGDRCFTISFAEESGIDAGGVFREGISRIVEDLFSEHFNLLLLCPNGQQVVHAGMDKYLPNPKHITPLALEMFEFIGKLMAMSIRAKLYLPFEFPPIIWKKIVGEEVSKFDLMEFDMITARQLDEIEQCHRLHKDLGAAGDSSSEPSPPITSQELFYEKYQGKLRFVYIGSDAVERELVLNGQQKEVTFENRFEYCELVRKARLNEFDVQIAAMAKGMGQVIPMRALLLFSAKQLEELVCGNPKIDLEVWKQNTETSGVSSSTVNLFWKVMESLSPQEQTGFVRFAWGRSRLPSKSEDFQMKMRLTSGGRAALPVSHTCFFSVELPDYRTEEEMRHGLLTAIHYGVGGILNG